MAKQSAQPAKGTRDFLPAEVRQRSYAIGVIRGVYERHGYEPLETPALERLDTLLGKYGEEGDQLLFKVLRRGQPLVEGVRQAGAHVADEHNLVAGRSGLTAPGADALLADLGLRYDLTVPLARVCAARQAQLPAVFKRYQIQPVWRADTPSRGRFREFYQCDVDVVGSDSLIVEAEVLGATAQCLKQLGFADFTFRLNHRQLLRALVEHAGIAAARETDAIVAIDKLDKIGADGVARELEGRGIEAEARTALLALLSDGLALDAIASALRGHARGEQAIAELREVLALSERTPAAGHLRFDLSLARGLGYYTGCIFEASVADLAGSLGGGGRYDGLVGMFSGRDVPACGFALGLERLLVVMAERKLFPDALSAADVMLGACDLASLPAALSLAGELRAGGLRVDLSPRPVKPGKLRKQADEAGAAAALWLEPGGGDKVGLWTRRERATESELSVEAARARLKDTIDESELP